MHVNKHTLYLKVYAIVSMFVVQPQAYKQVSPETYLNIHSNKILLKAQKEMLINMFSKYFT